MREASPVHRYYYSTYHLASDFVWSVAIASLFLSLASLLVPEIKVAFSAAVAVLDNFKSAPLVIAGIGFYALVLAAISMITHRVALIVRDVVRSLPGRHNSIGYKAIYRARESDINAMYRQHFPDGPDLSMRSTLSPTEMVNRLSAFMKLYNPEGYSHHYRTYAIVAAFRQSVLYTLVIAFILLARSDYLAGSLLLVVAMVLLLCLRFAAEQSVATEFDFIVATSRWISDKETTGSSNEEVSAERRITPASTGRPASPSAR